MGELPGVRAGGAAGGPVAVVRGVPAAAGRVDGHLPPAGRRQGPAAPALGRRDLRRAGRAGGARGGGRADRRRPGGAWCRSTSGRDHRFVDVTEDLQVLVVFAPPERPEE